MSRIVVFHKFKRFYYWLHHECHNKLLKMNIYSEEFYIQIKYVNKLVQHTDNELSLMNNFHYKSFERPEIEELKYKYDILKSGIENLKNQYSIMIGQNI